MRRVAYVILLPLPSLNKYIMHQSALVLALLTYASTTLSAPTSSNTTLPYSTWMATSFLSKSQGVINRHYVASVIHEGIQRAATLHINTTLLSYASTAISSLVVPNGTLVGWDPNYYSLDDLRIGNNILYFWDTEGRKESKYEVAARGLRKQLDRWPRTRSGGLWHRDPTYPNQMWLDGIYMAQPFYATYTHYFEQDNITAWEDIVHQFDLIENHTRNKTSGLLVHGYDESKKAVWAHPVTGACPHVWDRAVGWYFMALVDVLQVYPKELPGYERLMGYLETLAVGLKKAQDESGGWWLVMDEPYPGMKGNYIESSATAMFAYGYLKGVRTGLLDEGYRETAVKAYHVMLDRFVKQDNDGTLSWEGTVEVGSLSSNGSYEVSDLAVVSGHPANECSITSVCPWPRTMGRALGRSCLHVRRWKCGKNCNVHSVSHIKVDLHTWYPLFRYPQKSHVIPSEDTPYINAYLQCLRTTGRSLVTVSFFTSYNKASVAADKRRIANMPSPAFHTP